MIRFMHEEKQDQIKYHERQILELKDALRDRKRIQHESVVWSLAEACTQYPTAVDTYSRSVSLFITEKISPDTYEAFWQDIEDIMQANGFQFAKTISQGIRFTHPLYEYIDIEVRSSVCEIVPTGKLVPEIRTDCSFIQS